REPLSRLTGVKHGTAGHPPAGNSGNGASPGSQLPSHGPGFIPARVPPGGAGGFMSVNATAGTNQGSTNSQDNALQVGFDARAPVTVAVRVTDPLSGQVVEPGKSGGAFFGLDEDNYVKLVLATDDGSGTPGLVLGVETGGVYVANPSIARVPLNFTGMATLDLFLVLDPATNRITAKYRINSDVQADIRTLGTVDAAAFPALAGFFRLGA